MMAGSGAEAPAPLCFIRFMQQDYRLCRAARTDLEAMRVAVDSGLLHSQRLGVKAFLFGDFAHGEHWAVKAAHGHIPADLIGRPALTLVVGVLDDFELQSGRMLEADKSLTETFLLSAMRNFMPV